MNIDLQLFLFAIVIVIFLISCCGLLQRAKEQYMNEDRIRCQIAAIATHPPPIYYYTNNAYQPSECNSNSPPTYTTYPDFPPSYEEVIKVSDLNRIRTPNGITTV